MNGGLNLIDGFLHSQSLNIDSLSPIADGTILSHGMFAN
jgi:hypothetical protein